MLSRALIIALAAVTVLPQLSLADTPGPSWLPPKPAPECTPKADHSNYGLHNKSWCPWSTTQHWKPKGLGCRHDSECQRGRGGTGCIYDYTNGDDVNGRDADNLVTTGYGYCDYVDPIKRTGQTKCFCTPEVPQPHVGGHFNPPSHVTEYCQGAFVRNGFTGVIVVKGCGVNPHHALQCHFKCNHSHYCDGGDNPDRIHKLFPDRPSCPGFPQADPPWQ